MKVKLSLRHLLYAGLAILFIRFVYLNRGQLVDIVAVLRNGIWYYLLFVIVLFALIVQNQGRLYSSIYNILNLPPERKKLSAIFLVSRFMSVAAPSGGLSGAVPFIQDARRRNLAVGTVLVANLIYLIVWYSSFALVLLIGLLHLFLVHDLQWFEVAESIILIGFTGLLVAILALAWLAPDWLSALLHRVTRLTARIAAWLKRPVPLTVAQTDALADELGHTIYLLRHAGWGPALRPFAIALFNELLNLLILFFVALAFGVQMNLGVLVATYSIGILFFLISPTPGGLGFVEGILILVMTSLGIADESAATITLAYRGFTFWLPFILGFFALRRLERLNKAEASLEPQSLQS
ncbi:MAG: flippase-like domain-containing protein [Anaerolineales bacterium]|nr:flippase-like domain-containing protein [Anaerolineales bacterium]MCB8940058.1 flippase-like domain-containing protein [Ardenticatenaceae bacterium]